MQTTSKVDKRESHNLPFQVKLNWLADAPILSINVDAHTARKRVTTWVGDQVATMLMGYTPQLVIERELAYWRVPVVLTSSEVGVVGEVGAVNVDAKTGELALSTGLGDALIANALDLLRNNAPTADPASNST